jgi:predicted DNA-binding transcriptional regulator AlpA
MSHVLIPLTKVAETVGLSVTTVKRKARDRNDPFPAPIKTGSRRVAWDETEVHAWIEARIAERNARVGVINPTAPSTTATGTRSGRGRMAA